jgi:hypothetical protein
MTNQKWKMENEMLSCECSGGGHARLDEPPQAAEALRKINMVVQGKFFSIRWAWEITNRKWETTDLPLIIFHLIFVIW